MDHSARRSMKNAANCVKYGELQGSRNRNMSNAYGAFNITMLEARLSEGLLTSLIIFGVSQRLGNHHGASLEVVDQLSSHDGVAMERDPI